VRDEYGVWNTILKANPDGTSKIQHGMKYKIKVEYPDGTKVEKNPAWAKYLVQN